MIIYILLGLAVLSVIFVISMYNGLVTKRNRYKNAYAQIDVQLKRRHDLIPNLVETAKGFMKHEKDTLEAVISARSAASSASKSAAANPGDAQSMQGVMAAEAGLSGALGKLFALSEAYPDLKSNQNMLQVQEALTTTENKIAFSRQAYNDSVLNYNNARETFPTNIISGMFNFVPATMFEVTEEKEREPVKVDFS
jgi:LemA protein